MAIVKSMIMDFLPLLPLLLLLNCIFISSAKETPDFDRHLYPCHSTDFVCFQRQYKVLRDHVLLGQPDLKINTYEPYSFLYGDTGTCVRMSGLEESELTGIRYDSYMNEFSLRIEFPLKIHQVLDTGRCRQPKHRINAVVPYRGTLHQFTGNATITMILSYELKKKNNATHMELLDDAIDVEVNIPDLKYDDTADADIINADWAFSTAENLDAAEYIASPYCDNYRMFLSGVPLNRIIMLYPGDEYQDLQFDFVEDV